MRRRRYLGTMNAVRIVLDRWPLWAALASGMMLAIAHAFETFGNLAPCALCYRQREVYWAALAIGLAGYGLSRLVAPRDTCRVACALLALVFLFGAGLAAYHAGVEWKWWPGPTTCTGGAAGISPGDMADLLQGKRIRAPACDQPAWVFAGLSMAGWNALASLGLSATSMVAAVRTKGRHDR